MQAAAPTFVPPPQNGYQPLSEAEIYTIKKQYLGLLSRQQVIDLCLTFEAHAPLHVKSSVWPYDIRAAIASILARKAQASPSSPDAGTPSKVSAPDLASPIEGTTQLPASSSQPTPTSSQPSTSAQPVFQPTAPGPHYPHQPYYHPTYPHGSYYPPTPYSYTHTYPLYPQPSASYPVSPGHPPLFTNAPLVHPAPEPPAPLNNVEDLPSYEEMIVEALLDSGDPEGCAPKSLFGWMAIHYPLQMNFRPSASQALQKAYKRGRLEKGSNGKYRLNENWEGGSTSKRTTRRPQTLVQSTLPGPQPPSSPFTHTPLVPHGATHMQARLLPPGQPPGYGGYPFGYPCQGTPGSTSAIRDTFGTASQKQITSAADHETGEGSDAWEAAQNILKAINFGQLFQISNEENKAGESRTSASSAYQHTPANGPDWALSVIVPGESTIPVGVGKSAELNTEQRAALQAQLALLAAQLAELADVSEDELSHNLGIVRRTPTMSDTWTPQIGEGSGLEDNEMVEVPVPTSS